MAIFLPEAVEAAEIAAAAAEEYAPTWASSAGRSAWNFGKKVGQAALYGQGVYQAGKGLYDTGRNVVRAIGDDVHKVENFFSTAKGPAKGNISKIMPRRRYSVGPRPAKRPFRHGGVISRLPKRKMFTSGGYQGSFRKQRNRVRKDMFRLHGSTLKYEFARTSSGADVCEIGHSTCVPRQVVRSFGRAIVRRAFERTGDVITTWTDVPGRGVADYAFSWLYRTTPDSTTVTTTAPVVFTGADFAGCGDQVVNALLVLMTATVDNLVIEEFKIWEGWVTDAGNPKFYTLDMRSAKFTYAVTSVLTVQNLTESATGGTDDHTMRDDIRANPVVGRAWNASGNTLIPVDATGLYVAEVADAYTGAIGHIVATHKHPYPPNFFSNSRVSGQVKLGPGNIKKSKISTFKRLSVNGFLRVFRRWITANTDVTIAGFNPYVAGGGSSRFFMFEHMVKHSTDPSVQIGSEVNLFVKSHLTYRTKREAARIDL